MAKYLDYDGISTYTDKLKSSLTSALSNPTYNNEESGEGTITAIFDFLGSHIEWDLPIAGEHTDMAGLIPDSYKTELDSALDIIKTLPKYYTGNTTPSNTTGTNGDLYLQTS